MPYYVPLRAGSITVRVKSGYSTPSIHIQSSVFHLLYIYAFMYVLFSTKVHIRYQIMISPSQDRKGDRGTSKSFTNPTALLHASAA